MIGDTLIEGVRPGRPASGGQVKQPSAAALHCKQINSTHDDFYLHRSFLRQLGADHWTTEYHCQGLSDGDMVGALIGAREKDRQRMASHCGGRESAI